MGTGNAGSLNSPLAVRMHRLHVASDNPDMVVAHYPDPGECESADLGAIALTRDVAADLSSLYCGLSEYVHDTGQLRCAACGSKYTITDATSYGCCGDHDGKSCSNGGASGATRSRTSCSPEQP